MKKILKINIFLLSVYILLSTLFMRKIYINLGMINVLKFLTYSIILVLIDIKFNNLLKYKCSDKLPKRVLFGSCYIVFNKAILIVSEIYLYFNVINNFIYDTIDIYRWFSIIVILISILNYSYIYENKVICFLNKNFCIDDIKQICKYKDSCFGKRIDIKLNNGSSRQFYLSLEDYENLLKYRGVN